VVLVESTKNPGNLNLEVSGKQLKKATISITTL